MVLTRKIQISSQSNEFWNMIRRLNSLCYIMANRIVQEQAFNDAIEDQLTPDTGDYKQYWKERKTVAAEMYARIGTSKQNISYRMLAQEFSDQVGSAIYSPLNAEVVAAYRADQAGIAKGLKVQRTYKKGMAIPIAKQAFIQMTEEGFSLFGQQIYFVYGADLSGQRAIIKRILAGEYKMLNSSIKYVKKLKKCFLLLSVDIPVKDHSLNRDTTAIADITWKCPILLSNNKNAGVKEIGDLNQLAMLRYQLDTRIKNMQGLVYARGGKGRKRKLKALEQFHTKEIDIAKTFNHQVTARVIQEVIRMRAGTLTVIRRNEPLPEEIEKNMIRYWGHASIIEKLQYKCKLHGITFHLITTKENQD